MAAARAALEAAKTPEEPALAMLSIHTDSSPCASEPDASVELELTLEDFVTDPHLHSIFLQYLSVHDKKGFARLLFLVSVEEFKKLLRSKEGNDKEEMEHEQVTPAESDDQLYHRRMYASKIIAKFMSQDSFLDIASENLQILNKSVWSFGTYLRNDLMMCTALSSKMDLFRDAEIAVKKSLHPSFDAFKNTKQYRDVLTNAKISYSLITGDRSRGSARMERSPNSKWANETQELVAAVPDTQAASPTKAGSFLTLQRVLGNRRLCSVFWVFLFKERSHQQLSLWMDFRYQLKPALESFVAAAHAELAQNEGSTELDEESVLSSQPGDFIEQILSVGTNICDKYIVPQASARISFVSQADEGLLGEYEQHVASCMTTGTFSLVDAETLLRTVDKISSAIEYNLQVNDFVRFMGSDAFRSLMSSYQTRLISPRESMRRPEASDDCVSVSTSSDCSMTTLQELCHCMSVPSHQPQRERCKKFTLKELWLSQRRESQRASLISSVLSFHLDSSSNQSVEVKKEILYTLARGSDLEHHHALPEHVEAFFCPSGAKTVRAKSRPQPSLFHMTIGNAEKSFYGACLTRYVRQSDDSQLGPLEIVLREAEGLEVFVPVGLCIISRYPILGTLKKRLERLHIQMQRDPAYLNDIRWRPSATQMEELLIPFDFGTTAERVDFSLSEYVDFSLEELFTCLSVENVVALVNCMMLERQVVLVSSHYSVLTCVGETLKYLMSPLSWSHVFAPILPKSMLECLQCPTPYLFGVHASYRRELAEMLTSDGSSENIVVVDLDANVMSSKARPMLPEHIRVPLIAKLQQMLKPRVYFSDCVPMCLAGSGRPNEFPEARVRACFRGAMRQVLEPLSEFRFILSDEFDFVVVFDRIEFLRRRPTDQLAFYKSLLDTQMFSHYIATVT